MIKGGLLFIAFCFTVNHALTGQNKVTIHHFYEKHLKEKVQFTIDLPFKVRVRTKMIKRSEVPALLIYEFIPRGKHIGVRLSVEQSSNSLEYVVKMYGEAGGVVEKNINNGTYLVKFYKDSTSGAYYAILLKQVNVHGQTLCLELIVTGEKNAIDTLLPQLMPSVYTSTITD